MILTSLVSFDYKADCTVILLLYFNKKDASSIPTQKNKDRPHLPCATRQTRRIIPAEK